MLHIHLDRSGFVTRRLLLQLSIGGVALLHVLLLHGCGMNSPPASSPPVASPAPRAADIRFVKNPLLFAEVDYTALKRRAMPLGDLRGEWILQTPSSSGATTDDKLTLSFVSGGGNALTLDAEGKLVGNPDGEASLLLDGFGVGSVSSTLAWGLEPSKSEGWLASPYRAQGSPTERSLTFHLIGSDLLRVSGRIEMHTGLVVEFDTTLVRWYGSVDLFVEVVSREDPPLPDNDPTIEASGPVAFRGTWTAEANGRNVSLAIDEHRLVGITTQAEGMPPQSWKRVAQYNAGNHSLEFALHSGHDWIVFERLQLTLSGKLLWRAANLDHAIVLQRSGGTP